MESFTLEVKAEDNSARLDVFLLKNLPSLGSRSFIQKLISDGNVTVNNKKVTKSHQKVKAYDEVAVQVVPHPTINIKPEDIPLNVVYEDDDVLVINKPAGMVVHPAPGNYSGTLVNAILYHHRNLSDINLPFRPGIVHRLDKDTSGLLLVAKNNIAHIALARQFQKHTIIRKYIALVKGIVQLDEDVIELPLGRHSRHREKIAVKFFQSRAAQTRYRV